MHINLIKLFEHLLYPRFTTADCFRRVKTRQVKRVILAAGNLFGVSFFCAPLTDRFNWRSDILAAKVDTVLVVEVMSYNKWKLMRQVSAGCAYFFFFFGFLFSYFWSLFNLISAKNRPGNTGNADMSMRNNRGQGTSQLFFLHATERE